jgi:hypothetical protein
VIRQKKKPPGGSLLPAGGLPVSDYATGWSDGRRDNNRGVLNDDPVKGHELDLAEAKFEDTTSARITQAR